MPRFFPSEARFGVDRGVVRKLWYFVHVLYFCGAVLKYGMLQRGEKLFVECVPLHGVQGHQGHRVHRSVSLYRKT